MLRTPTIRWLLFLVLCCLPQGATQAARPASDILPPAAAPAIYLKSRTIMGAQLPVVLAGGRNVPVTSTVRMHGIVQVWAHATDADRAVLATAGITLLDYLPEMAWLASFPPEYLAGAAVPAPAGRILRALLPLQANDKLEPALRAHGLAAWSQAPDGIARVSVQFFRDVSAAERTRILARYGGHSLGGQLVSVPRSSLSLLLGEDAVQWIENGPPPLGAANSGARTATGVSTVQDSDAALIGTGVKVGIWDGGAVYAHSDFGTRLTVVEAGTANSHATHVAGSIGGSGAGNALAKGMAPGATLFSYDFNGTVPSEMASAISAYGIALSNNSWGYSLADPPTAAQCAALRGVYGSDTRSYDQLVRGEYASGVAAISLLFAAGNDRANNWPLCQTTTAPYANYGTILGPGSTAKNTIVVGAVCDSSASLYASCIDGSGAVVGGGADFMSTFSDWGPMADGRIKPDVVAPGVEILSTDVNGTYTNKQGTSMATPVTTGVAALLYQKWRALNSNVDPPPATIKALLVQTAVDLSSSTLSFFKTGPDYASGYGRINAVAAVAAISDGLVRRDQVANSAQDIFAFTLASGAPALKITLVWDDPAATANAAATLVNNLDLQLVGPDGVVYRPYVLNAANPSAAATTGIDSINNVEQVYVAAPGAGGWQAKVTGSSVPTGPQNYSLAGSVRLFVGANNVDTDPALLVTQSASSTDLVEGGVTDSYTVRLSTQPTNTVVIIPGGVSPAQFTYSPSSVTFSTTNYDVPQVITVTAMDDSTVEGYHTALVTHTVTGYNNLPNPYPVTDREQFPTSFTANINDNDGNVAIVETGTSTHTVRPGETLPSIALQYGVVLEVFLKNNPGVSAELLRVGDVLQLPTNNTTRTVVREGGGITDTYTVYLLTAPTGHVSVTLGDGMNALQVTPSGTDPGYSHDVTFTTAGTTTATSTVTLTFTPANYSTPQTVTVLALDDALKEGVEKISITHHVRSVSNSGSSTVVSDSTYNGASANRVSVTVLDNDVGIATMGADFDGDGKTDYAIYRPGTAQYFVRKSTDSTAEVVTWGDVAQADRPVPADYDGDGKSDYAVYRPGTAQFLVRKSTTGIAEVVTWGIAGGGDRPAVADFDGDGRVDYAIYRSTTAMFIVKNSADNTTVVVNWGVANGSDTPVVGDYDGDGKADYAVYRRPSAEWLIKQSSNGAVVVTAWGLARSADIPVPGDYDGDGKSDLAIFRPETAEFFVRQSRDVSLAVTRWGIAGGGDVPVPGDYDGDGKMDKAIFRPSTAVFLVQKSSTLTPIDPLTTWGLAGGYDYPLPVPDPNFDGTVYGFIGQ